MSEISQAGWGCLAFHGFFYGFSIGFPVEYHGHGVVITCYNRCLAGVVASLDC
jgi:hypothetical protein